MKTLTHVLTVAWFAVLIAAAQAEDATAPSRQKQVDGIAQKIKELRQERLTALKDGAEIADHLARKGRASIEEACEARMVAFQAEFELTEQPGDQVALCQSVVEALEQYEELAKAKKAAARGTELGVLRVKVRRLEVEIHLEEAKAKLSAASK